MFSAFTILEAKAIFSKENIDLVICDITLPDGNGLDFGKVVREKSNAVLIYYGIKGRNFTVSENTSRCN